MWKKSENHKEDNIIHCEEIRNAPEREVPWCTGPLYYFNSTYIADTRTHENL